MCARHSKGYRNRSRKLLSKGPRERGRPGLGRLLYEYKEGDAVVIDVCPNFISTAPHREVPGQSRNCGWEEGARIPDKSQ